MHDLEQQRIQYLAECHYERTRKPRSRVRRALAWLIVAVFAVATTLRLIDTEF